MLPGSTISSLGAPASGWTTFTRRHGGFLGGCARGSPRRLTRPRMPQIDTDADRSTTASTTSRAGDRRAGGGAVLPHRFRWFVVALGVIAVLRCGDHASDAVRPRLRLRRAAAVQQAEDGRDEEQRGDGGHDQAADHGAAERRVLLAAFAQAERHRDHADDHRQRGHQHRAEAA